jgi:molybdopterin-binding protein
MVDTVKMEVRFETLDGDVITRIITAGSVDQPRYHWLLK